jgi:hypothetical protein
VSSTRSNKKSCADEYALDTEARSRELPRHLGRYRNEFSCRFNRPESQLAMFGMTIENLVRGEVLPYKTLTARLGAQTVVLIEPYYVKSVVNKSTVYTPSVIVNIRSNTKLPSF